MNSKPFLITSIMIATLLAVLSAQVFASPDSWNGGLSITPTLLYYETLGDSSSYSDALLGGCHGGITVNALTLEKFCFVASIQKIAPDYYIK